MKKIKVAIVAVGNCASSLIQGLEFYTYTSWHYPIGSAAEGNTCGFAGLPNPFKYAGACEVLIRWLNEQGYVVTIIHYANDHSEVSIEKHPEGLPIEWEGDDWKQGVCELSLKVIDES